MLDFSDSQHQLMHIVVETRLVDNELMKIVISGQSNLTKGRIAVHTIRLIVITKWNMYPRDQYDRRAKFRRNRSNGCGDRAIYRFFSNMAAVRHLVFVGPLLRPSTKSTCPSTSLCKA